MNCKNLIQELESYLDGALDDALRAAMEEHLSRCRKCRLIVDTTRKTIQIFCNSDPLPLSEDTRKRLHVALMKKLQHPGA